HGIDGQFPASIILAEHKPVTPVSIPPVSTCDSKLRPIGRDLIREWPLLNDLSSEIALRIDARRCAVDSQADLPRVGARLHRQIVFKLAGIAVVDSIDSRIKFVDPKTRVVGNRAPPLALIVADKDIAGRAQPLDPFDPGGPCGSFKLQPHTLRVSPVRHLIARKREPISNSARG